MYWDKIRLSSGENFALIARRSTEDRLAGTCFRVGEQPRAGNFIALRSVRDVFKKREVMQNFLEEINSLPRADRPGTCSVTIECARPLGWASTIPLDGIDSVDLEPFEINRRSRGLRVKSTSRILAPLVRCLTVVYEFKMENGSPVAVVHSIYPGDDVGELVGNVSRRENVAFLDWDHPGVRI